MNSKQTQIQRRAQEIEKGKEELAGALKRGLLLLRYLGHCKCGLMLTERDRNAKKATFRCPHCGASGPLVAVT